MSEQLPEGVTKQEFAELQGAVKDLADAFKAQQSATTAAEKKDAQEDVQEARADLDTLAKELGIPVGKLRDAAEEAKKQARKDELRPILLELLDEEMADPPAEGEPTEEEPAAEGEEEPATEEPAPVEDSAPTQAHWSERSLGEILNR